MSTILDALRKLEEERHSRTADARSRLLLSPTIQTRLVRPQRSPWKAKGNLLSVLGFLAAGFSAGAGFFFWRSDPGQTSPAAVVVASSPAKDTAAIEKISPTDTHSISPSTPVEAVSETFSPEQESDSPPLAVAEAPSPLPSSSLEEQDAARASVSAVQHSPFVAAPPPLQEAPPPQREVSLVAKHAPTPPPLSPDNKEKSSALYEVLLPSGATRTVPSPTASTPPPANVGAPTTPSGTSLSFLQWSSDPERRIAFLRVNGGPLTMAHEGDTIDGYTVVEIRQNGVELQSGETRMTLRP